MEPLSVQEKIKVQLEILIQEAILAILQRLTQELTSQKVDHEMKF